MAKELMSSLERMLYATLVGVQVYDNEGNLKTVVDVNFEEDTNQIIYEFNDGGKSAALLTDELEWEMPTIRARIKPNKKRLKRKK